MNRDYNISKVGLKLIKAYEGYRPVDRELVTGQRVVGYGHRLYNDDARHLTKAQAEALLRNDLAPFEDMINENVHAPLTQSQYDALCSFAFNIGPKAFLQSDTLRALNNGRPLDAANGLDVWRKSTINGKTYVVDALMRRRTAEKALFLRTENGKALAAPRLDLEPVRDEAVALLSTEDALPVFTNDDAIGIVATAPHSASYPELGQTRRRDDLNDMAQSERDLGTDWEPEAEEEPADDVLNLDQVVKTAFEETTERASSLIAQAAAELSGKLDSLIDNADYKPQDSGDWPESLIDAGDTQPTLTLDQFLPTTDDNDIETAAVDEKIEPKADIVIDEMAADDAMRESRDSASKYIQTDDFEAPKASIGGGYWMTLLAGFVLLGASLAAMMRGVEGWLDGWGPLLTFAGVIIGGVMVLAALFYAIRASLR